MKTRKTARPRVAALLMAAAAFPLNALAQDVAPPTVAPTAAPPAPAPAPVAARPAPTMVQPTPDRPVYTPEQIAESEASLRPKSRPVARPAARPVSAPRAMIRSAPDASATTAPAPVEPTPAPVATTPVETLPPPPVAADDTPVSPTGEAPSDATIVADTAAGTTPWTWIIGGLVALGAIIGLVALMRRRRRDDDVDVAEIVTLPVAAPQPAATKVLHPVAAPQPAVISQSVAPKAVAGADDIPAGRPWLRMTLQPTGVEAIGDGKTLFYDLIIENEGSEPARDVRVSSFLFGDAQSAANERALIVPVGASRPVSASVPLPVGGSAKVVADIRYPLPDGTEGHVAARFAIDTTGDTLEAKVDRVLERI